MDLFNTTLKFHKKICNLLFITFIFLFVFETNVNADEIKKDYINNNGIIITQSEYSNLINLGFSENEIYNMNFQEYNENKNLNGIIKTTKEKYYKIITEYDYEKNIIFSYNKEINKSEYENNIKNTIMPFGNGLTETEYKKVTTQIIAISNGYRYKTSIEWKNMPSKRSYDIIGIGIDSNVYISSDIVFQQNYCYSNGSCSSSNLSTIKKTNTGGAALFQLPSGSITSLNSYIYFNINKQKNNTIYSLNAYGDYSHAISTTSSSNSNKYNINSGGISLYSTIINDYDAIPTAKATWSGNW